MLVIPNRIRENLGKVDSQADLYDLCILCLYLTEQASTKETHNSRGKCLLFLSFKETQNSR